VVIDDRFCFIGSHNLTHSALVHNHEFSLLLDNRRLADELDSYITRLMMGENSK
jgi:phosphatidylserine/phosphatidylglycerophosphate/cardiolipin synthase-like enzyme